MALSLLALLLAQATALAALVATAYVAGARVVPPTPGRRLDALDLAHAARSLALGLAVLATAGALLGLAHLLRRDACLVAAAALHLTGLPAWRRIGAAARRAATSRAARLGCAAGLVAVGPLWVASLYPPTAFDETLYHLPTARAFAGSGALPFLADLRFPVFPHLAEVLAAEMLLFADDVATHAVALTAVAATALLLLGWGRAWKADDVAPRGWIAAALWLGSPLVVYLSGAGYVEPLLALFATAACFSFWCWRRSGAVRELVLAGAFAGAAASTKYLGLFFVVALGLGAVLPRDRGRVRAAVAFFAVAAAAMAPWYGRILGLTGNPVFPYLSGLFGANDWTPVHFYRLGLPAAGDAWSSLVDGAARLLTLPWDAVARRGRVGGLPPLSPAILVGLPFAVAATLADRGARRLLWLALGFVALFPALPADVRYLVTVLPLVSLAAAVGLAGTVARWPRPPGGTRAALVLAWALAAPGLAYAGYRVVRQGPPPATAPERAAFLRRAVPLFAALEHAAPAGSRPAVVYGLHAENLRDYARGTFYGDWYGPHRYQLLPELARAPAGASAVLRRWGVTHLLVARRRTALPPEPAAARAGLRLVYQDDAGVLYALGAPQEGAGP